MAVKYLDASLTTGNNDGTSAADAWQDYFDVMTNAFATSGGTLAAGDTVHIRTADASGADIVIDQTSNWTYGHPGTFLEPVRYVFDDGTIWPHGGRLLIRDTTQSVSSILIPDGALWIGKDNNWGFEFSRYAGSTKIGGNAYVKDLYVECTHGGGSWQIELGGSIGYLTGNQTNSAPVLENYYYKQNGSRNNPDGLVECNYYGKVLIINPIFDLSGCTSLSGDMDIFNLNHAYNGVKVIGGKILQPVSQLVRSQLKVLKTNVTSVSFIEVDNFLSHPDNQLENTYRGSVNPGDYGSTRYNKPFGKDGEFYYLTNFYELSALTGANYPAVSSTVLPGTALDTYSWRVKPTAEASYRYQCRLPPISKFNSLATGVRTITLHFLFDPTIVTELGNETDFGIVANYTNSSGETATDSTITDPSAIQNSSADWAPVDGNGDVIYGAQTYVKKEVVLTTSESVLVNSIITVNVVFRTRFIADAFWFIDPDIALT